MEVIQMKLQMDNNWASVLILALGIVFVLGLSIVWL